MKKTLVRKPPLGTPIERADKIHRIVLTAGPGGGKTTAKNYLIEEMGKLGFHVIFLQEVARSLIQEGFIPGKTISIEDFQEMVIEQQILKEDAALKYAPKDRPVIIFCDRGVLDNAAYTTPDAMKRLSQKFDFDLSGLDRYDGVIVLGSCPEKFYQQDAERRETYREAVVLGERIKHAWAKCNWKFVPSFEDFEKKKRVLGNVVRAMVGIPQKLEIEYKFLCAPGAEKSIPRESILSTIEITQAYLSCPKDREERVRMRVFPDGIRTYHHTIKRSLEGNVRVEDERFISHEEYRALLKRASRSRVPIKKTRYVFHLGGKEIYEIDVFKNGKQRGLTVLEVEVSNPGDDPVVPEWLPVIENVTGDPRYSNETLSRKRK